MKYFIIDEDTSDVIHDCYYDVKGIEPTKQQIINVFNKLPQNIKEDIDKWGAWDTVVRENIFVFIRDKYEIKKYKKENANDKMEKWLNNM